MLTSRRTVLMCCAALFALTGCGDLSRPSRTLDLPPIVMTTGGGFAAASSRWTISPDGSWTKVTEVHSETVTPPPPVSGRLTEAQRQELAYLANDQELHIEMLREPGACTVSDGDEERLEIGPDHYLSNWCDEYRPRIAAIREQIRAFTVRS
jgi:hypothetical protein